ncbi:thiamine phosphate synthase [Formosa sp. A9]|uniref:thiamine phosphate synthase n=1 Tax=Formosa sp. A9 TaxID=3442641 RepID=UPI003EBC6949
MISKLHFITQGSTSEQHITQIKQACACGADWVQLRMKNFDDETLLKTAEQARTITNSYQAKLIINDHFQIVQAVKADGVHLGKNDACPETVRAILGSDFIIGGTANTLADCQNLIEKQVDYIGLGPFRFTETKSNLSPILGLEGYQFILKNISKPMPVIAIGGITTEDLPELLKTRIYGVAMSGTIIEDFNCISEIKQSFNTPPKQ